MDSNRNGREDRIFVNPADTQPLEDRALKAAAQFMGQELLPLLGVEGRVSLLLTPLMNGDMSQRERIERSLKLLQKERGALGHEDFMRMQSVLYTLAMKFLSMEELSHMKEVLNMTVLGQMIMQDGIEKGIEKGEERVNRLNQILAKANRTEDIVKASGDKEYQKKLFEEFQL